MNYAKILQFLVFSAAAIASTTPAWCQTGKTRAHTEQRIHRIEANVASIPMGQGQPPLQFDLQTLMQTLHIPGLSVAVIDNFQIVWAKGYGVTESGSHTPVTAKTLFQAASISKTVTAVAALRLVEQGKLSLDEDVNKKLTSWKVPENDFTKDQKVTLRRIMSHSGGLTVHGFPGYATDAPIPTLVQILNGEKPANTEPIRVDIVPGTVSRYSGGGVTIEQQLLTDVTGKPFPQFMRETVLDKIGMTDSTFEQPLPAAKVTQAASATHGDGTVVPGKWHVYPEMAAAGLWTTPTDLAKFGIEIARSKHGKSNRILSEKTTGEMLTPQIEHVGLAFFLAEHNPDQFGHTGGNEGFQSILLMLGDSGQGVAIMGNSDNLFWMEDYLVETIAKEYGWKYIPPKHFAGNVLLIVANTKGAHAAIQTYWELKKASPSDYVFEEGDLNQFGYDLLKANKSNEALEAFKLNVEEYPKSWNVYDSLGEAYMGAGQTDLAIQNYEKSLELNPKNKGGAAMLDKLKNQKK
jgi:CubicO group peptidase (beta-lactamase class C family)